MRDMIWKCQDGRRLLVSQMETSHIINCIRMIQRKVAEGERWRIRALPRLELELEIRSLAARGEIIWPTPM